MQIAPENRFSINILGLKNRGYLCNMNIEIVKKRFSRISSMQIL